MQVDLSLKLPDTIQVTPQYVKTIAIYGLFGQGILTSGQAAELLGVSKRTFLESTSQYGVSVFQYDEYELVEEIEQR